MRKLIASFVLIAGPSSAFACLNGWDSPNEEQEFRSQYGTKPNVENATISGPSRGLLVVGGFVGVFAAAALVFTAGRTRS